MPSTYAHFVFGKKVYKKQPKKIQELIKKHRELYLIGIHGPDILFYYKALTSNSVNSVGFGLHEKPSRDFFSHGLELLQKKASDQDAMLSYLLGFLCHFALDSTCHGYIENKIQVSGIFHTEIEVEFDRMLMENDGYDPLRHCLTKHIRPKMENAEIIAPFFPGLSARQIQKSLKSMIWYNQLLLAPQEWKRRLIYSVLRISGNYPEMHGLIVNKAANPKCADSNLRLEKLMDKAISLCLKLTENYLSAMTDKENLSSYFDKTFGPGKDWKSIPVYSLKEELHYEV